MTAPPSREVTTHAVNKIPEKKIMISSFSRAALPSLSTLLKAALGRLIFL